MARLECMVPGSLGGKTESKTRIGQGGKFQVRMNERKERMCRVKSLALSGGEVVE